MNLATSTLTEAVAPRGLAVPSVPHLLEAPLSCVFFSKGGATPAPLDICLFNSFVVSVWAQAFILLYNPIFSSLLLLFG